MLPYKRADRVGDMIRAELADILLREVEDPALRLITLTYVDLSNDLCQARVYIQVGKHPQKVLGRLRKAAGFLRGRLALRMQLRRMPELSFFMDQTTEKTTHLLNLLEQIHKQDGTETALISTDDDMDDRGVTGRDTQYR